MRLLDRLRRLPRGTRVLLYPVGYWQMGRAAEVSYYVPFVDEMNRFTAVVCERRLVEIPSNYDHLGQQAWPKSGLVYEQAIQP